MDEGHGGRGGITTGWGAYRLVERPAVIWVATYLALGLPVLAAIPFAYQVVS